MKLNGRSTFRAALVIALVVIITIASTRLRADTGACGGASISLPFSDVPSSSVFFCSIAEAYFSGLSNGTSGTTYGPGNLVTREQMAAFVSRTMDQSLKRGSKRADLNQPWTPTILPDSLGLTTVGDTPEFVESDGADLWVANYSSGDVSRVRASDGKLLETWSHAPGAVGLLAAKGLIFATGYASPGKLYQINPTQPAGPVTTLTSGLGDFPRGISFDGTRIWTANDGGSVSIITLNPLSVNTLTDGFDHPVGILYDGNNVWVTDGGGNPGSSPGNLFKLDSNGAIIQTVPVGIGPWFPVFDGTNIWAPNHGSASVTVVRASTGAVLATLTGNFLTTPNTAAFDGERILVTNLEGNSVSLWKATDLSPIVGVFTDSSIGPYGACSDGLNFWITLQGASKLARF